MLGVKVLKQPFQCDGQVRDVWVEFESYMSEDKLPMVRGNA